MTVFLIVLALIFLALSLFLMLVNDDWDEHKLDELWGSEEDDWPVAA